MTVMPEVHDALADAVEAQGARARRRRWRPRRGATLLLAAGAIVVSGTAVAATTGWHPQLGGPDRGNASEARTPIPPDELALLAVLRRPQTAADRSPRVRAVLRLLGRDGIGGVHVDGIRLLQTRPDGVTILLPAERSGPARVPHTRRVLCLVTSTEVRAHTVTLTGHGVPPRTERLPAGVSAGAICGDAELLRTSGIRSSGAANASSDGIVPDGVARVVVRLRGRRFVTVPVHENFFSVQTGELTPFWPLKWLDASGNVIEHARAKRAPAREPAPAARQDRSTASSSTA